MTLQLLICTIDEGINSVAQLILTPAEGISYVISWQHSGNENNIQVPSQLIRDDISIYHLQGRGLSRNRNNALRHATAQLCLIADDDCRYTHEWLQSVIKTFEEHTATDLATFKMKSDYCQKIYPTQPHDLQKPARKYYSTSFEIAFRREKVIGNIQFNENFGLGSAVFHCCEEEIFIHDAISRGLQCWFYPITIVEHNHPTTDTSRATEPHILMAKGAYLYIGYRSKMLLYPFAIAWKTARMHRCSYFRSLWYLFKGLKHIIKHPELATQGLL